MKGRLHPRLAFGVGAIIGLLAIGLLVWMIFGRGTDDVVSVEIRPSPEPASAGATPSRSPSPAFTSNSSSPTTGIPTTSRTGSVEIVPPRAPAPEGEPPNRSLTPKPPNSTPSPPPTPVAPTASALTPPTTTPEQERTTEPAPSQQRQIIPPTLDPHEVTVNFDGHEKTGNDDMWFQTSWRYGPYEQLSATSPTGKVDFVKASPNAVCKLVGAELSLDGKKDDVCRVSLFVRGDAQHRDTPVDVIIRFVPVNIVWDQSSESAGSRVKPEDDLTITIEATSDGLAGAGHITWALENLVIAERGEFIENGKKVVPVKVDSADRVCASPDPVARFSSEFPSAGPFVTGGEKPPADLTWNIDCSGS